MWLLWVQVGSGGHHGKHHEWGDDVDRAPFAAVERLVKPFTPNTCNMFSTWHMA